MLDIFHSSFFSKLYPETCKSPGILFRDGEKGQTITVKVTEVTNLLGSWVMYYKLADE